MRLDSRKKIASVLVIGGALALAALSPACITNPAPIVETQPDGSRVTVFFKGDKFNHWYEDTEGFTVVQSERDRSWHYAELDPVTRELAPTKLLVGRDDPAKAGLKPKLQPPEEVIRAIASRRLKDPDGFDARAAGGGQRIAPTGTIKNLVVLMKFSDHTGRTLPTPANYDTLFNAASPDATFCPTGSVKAFYSVNSYGTMTLNSTVVAWVTLPNTESFYANGQSGLTTRTHDAIRAALTLVDPLVNFDDFDADNNNVIDSIAFVHSGYGAENGGTDAFGATQANRMWSHRWSIAGTGAFTSAEGVQVTDYHINPGVWGTSGSNIGRVGVIVHETGHFFGLPDLYDTDSTPGEGAGSWSVMANSWGFTFNQYNPPHFDGWSKTFLGWATPTVITTPGVYNLSTFNVSGQFYKITNGFPANEYLLIENRQNTGFETTLPQQGIVMFHIDDAAGFNAQGYPGAPGWPANGQHYRVSVLQADGNYNLERGNNRGDAGDVWFAAGRNQIGDYGWGRTGGTPAVTTYPNTDRYQGGTITPTKNRITEISAPGSTMSFRYSTADTITLTPTAFWSATGFQGGDVTPSTKQLVLQNVSASSINWTATPPAAWLSLSTSNGTLAAGASVNISAAITPAANCLAAGVYDTIITMNNTTNGVAASVGVQLTMSPDKDCNGNLIGDTIDVSGPPAAGANACASAQYISPGQVYTGSTASATNDGQTSCGDSDTSRDMWYKYKPRTSGTVTFSTCAQGSFDTVLSLHSGCPGTAANTLACNDDTACASSGQTSQISFAVTANVDYLVRVSGWQSSSGNYSLSVTGPLGFLTPGPGDVNANGIPDSCESMPDLDADGKPDACESANTGLLQTGMYTNSMLKDSDGDGISDGQESSCDCFSLAAQLTATNARDWDTDNDGWGDGLERLFPGTFVNGPLVADSAFADSDGDGLPNSLDANDVLWDSDGDLFSDCYEVAQGTNPSSSASRPPLGDVTGNGTFDIADVSSMADANLGLSSMVRPWNSDMTLDGIIDLSDVATAADMNLGLVGISP